MTKLLVRLFIKDPENVADEKVRTEYGTLSSVTGIVCNVLLFLVKLLIGLSIQSVSITSDAFNNLSDCMSSLITLFGYRLSAKPADREHPFGHGRMEYVVSLVVSLLIFLVGYELLRQSVEEIMHPRHGSFSWILTGILAMSIIVKLWLSRFNMTLGRKIDNIGMIASGEDARNDVLSTAVALIGLIMNNYTTSFPFDGIGGLIVSCMILYGGYQISRQVISRLLGTPASLELCHAIEKQILSHPEIIGVHDMIINDYGPGTKIGSAHAEVDASMNIIDAHDVIDRAEREVADNQHVLITLHMDPVVRNDPMTDAYHEETQRILKSISPELSMHDFRMVAGRSHTNLVFDVLVPFGFKMTGRQIKDAIDKAFSTHLQPITTVITFDHNFMEQQEELR